MIFPVGIIANWLLKKGLDEKATGPVAWVIAIVILAIALGGGWALLKDSIIDEHMTGERADRAEQQLERQEQAQGRSDEQERRDEAVIDDLREGANDAARDDPEGAGSRVGPVTRSVHDRLREERQAERNPPGD